MNKRELNIRKLNGFTIMEALIVLALLSILIAFFFGTINRLGEQTKNEVLIKGELNDWFAFRANLFIEFDAADSIVSENEAVFLYISERKIKYEVIDEKLFRVENELKQNLNIPMFGIDQKVNQTVFRFNWKGEELKMPFNMKMSLEKSINDYFISKAWQ